MPIHNNYTRSRYSCPKSCTSCLHRSGRVIPRVCGTRVRTTLFPDATARRRPIYTQLSISSNRIPRHTTGGGGKGGVRYLQCICVIFYLYRFIGLIELRARSSPRPREPPAPPTPHRQPTLIECLHVHLYIYVKYRWIVVCVCVCVYSTEWTS